MNKLQGAVLKTLAYADIFDYPLTAKEIHRWLIKDSFSSLQSSYKSVLSVLSSAHSKITQADQYYALKNRHHLIALRKQRTRYSRPKLKLARRVGEWLKFIPTIKMVAVTGALAMNNSHPADDIDLMIVASPNTLWLTRLLVIPLISLIAKRRKPATRHPLRASSHRDSICLNLWLDTTALSVPPSRRNLYTAHEVAQVKPLWDKNNTYQKFLSANSWIKKFLPNVKIRQSSAVNHQSFLLSLFNQLAYQLQFLYMRSKITNERVSLHSAFFHPRDTTGQVMRQYHYRLKKLGLAP